MIDRVWRKHYMASLQSSEFSGDDTNHKLLVWGHGLWPFERDYAVWRVDVEQWQYLLCWSRCIHFVHNCHKPGEDSRHLFRNVVVACDIRHNQRKQSKLHQGSSRILPEFGRWTW